MKEKRKNEQKNRHYGPRKKEIKKMETRNCNKKDEWVWGQNILYVVWCFLHLCACVVTVKRSKGKEFLVCSVHSYIFLAVVIISTYGDLCHYFIHMLSNLLYHIPMYVHAFIHIHTHIPCLCPYRKEFLFYIFSSFGLLKLINLFYVYNAQHKNYYKQNQVVHIQHNYLWT